MLRDNLKTAIDRSGFYVKEVAAEADVSKRTIDKWVGAAATEPRVLDLYRVCRALQVTMEEIVDGQDGLEYVRGLIAKEGRLWEPPERIKIAVDVLNHIDDTELRTVEKMINALRQYEAESPGFPLYTREPEPEYGAGAKIIDISRYTPQNEHVDGVIFTGWEMTLLPYMGKTAGGEPIDINAYTGQAIPFPLPSLRGKPENYFCVMIVGTSMTDADIHDGDYVVIRRAEEPVDGRVMLVRYENSSTLKKIKIEETQGGRRVYLCWEDGSGTMVPVDSTDYQIQGEYFSKMRK